MGHWGGGGSADDGVMLRKNPRNPHGDTLNVLLQGEIP